MWRRIVAWTVLLFVLPGLALAEKPKRAMTPEDVLAIQEVSDPQVAPDGDRVVYVVTRADRDANDYVANLWLKSVGGNDPPVQLTTSTKSDTHPRWSPDGNRIAFLSTRDKIPQIWIISPNGGEASPLTASKTPVKVFTWSPDSKRIAYVAERVPTPEEEARTKAKEDARVVDRDPKNGHLWVVDVTSREMQPLFQGAQDVSDPQWSPEGRLLAFTVANSPHFNDQTYGSSIRLLDLETKKSRRLDDGEDAQLAPRWSPDGREIVFLSRDVRPGVQGFAPRTLRAAPVQGGKSRALTVEFDHEPKSAFWSADSSEVRFLASVGTSSRLFTVAADGGKPTELAQLAGSVSAFSASDNGQTLAFTQSTSLAPAEVHVLLGKNLADARRLTDHNAACRQFALGKSELVRWKGRDHLELEGLLLLPSDYDKSKSYPLVVLAHGGPSSAWEANFPATWVNYGHVWCGRGFACFYPNVRGSSNYGKQFQLANFRDLGGGDFQDLLAGVDHLVQRNIANPDRLALVGWSYGGFLTAWGVTQTTRFKAAVAGAGIGNWTSMYSTSDTQRYMLSLFGARPWKDPDLYRRLSPITHADRAKTPTLILHGLDDVRVPPDQSREIYQAWRDHGVKTELVFYPREPHGLKEPAHRLDKMRREIEWIENHIQTHTPPRSTESNLDPLDAVNRAMREAHTARRAAELAAQSPLILVDSPKLVLFRKSERLEVPAEPKRYHELKAVAHIPLAAYLKLKSLVDRKLDQSAIDDLRLFRASIDRARASLADRGFPKETLERQKAILDQARALLDEVIDKGTLPNERLQQFTRGVASTVDANAEEAARLQIDHLHAQVTAWKEKLSAEEWGELRVIVVGSQLPRKGNLAVQYFARALGVPGEGPRLLYAEGLFEERRALNLLATYVVDEDIGRAFFNDPERLKVDLLERAARRYLAEPRFAK